MHIFFIYMHKEKFVCVTVITKDWNYVWNKYCNLSFLAICRSQLSFLIFLAPSWYQKAKIGLRISLWNKKIINSHINGLYKTTCYKTKSNFSQFFFSLTTVWLFFLFPYQRVSKCCKIYKILLIKMEKIWKYW